MKTISAERRTGRLRAVLLGMVILAGADLLAQNCVQWVQRTNVGTPGKRRGHAMAYDSDRHVTVFFGGEYHPPGNNNLYYSDTWEYDGTLWRPITIAGSIPTARFNHKMCYDTARHRVLMVGGADEDGLVGDAWAYNSTGPGTGQWVQISYDGGGADFGLAFDEVRGVALLVGGIIEDTTSIFQVREWNGTNWTLTTPLADDRSHLAIAYDSNRGIIRVQGGIEVDSGGGTDPVYDDTLDFIPGAGWSVSPASTGGSALLRYKHAMVYDRIRDRMVLFGGVGFFPNPHLEYHPSFGWRNMTVSTPPNVIQHAMVYDQQRRVTVLFGGTLGSDESDQTWELLPVRPVVTLPGTNYFDRCYLGAIDIDMNITTPPGSRYQWFHNSSAMPGATNTFLHFSALAVSDSGPYYLSVDDPCGNNTVGPIVTLVVHTSPTITQFDTSRRERCPGDSVTFSVSAESLLPMVFQWYGPNYQLIPGATNDTLVLNSLTPTNTGNYYVEVGNQCGWSTSFEAHLQVGPSIIIPPHATTVGVCNPTALAVNADGVGLVRYQWRLDGANLSSNVYFSGVNSFALLIQPCLYAHEGNYDVIVSDNCGALTAVTSAPVKLTITPGPEWVLRATNGPPARSDHAMTYDRARGLTILSGGWRTNSGGFERLSDVWEWNGVTWTQRLAHSTTNNWVFSPTTGWKPSYSGQPVNRRQHMLAYDTQRGRVVLFGGETTTPDGFQFFLRDTWEWDGATWQFRATNGPAQRSRAAMAYDTHRGVTVMTGGFLNAADPNPNTVWEWNGTNWQSFVPTNGPQNYSQEIGGMAYDSFRRKMIFGPSVGETYGWTFRAWDGQSWTTLFDGFFPQFYQQQYGDLAFDSYRRRSVWFGGNNPPSNATGFFDGQNWEVLTYNPAPPTPRYNMALAYDTNRHATVMFGGETGSLNFNRETWELIALDVPLINEQPASQLRPPGQTATFRVTAQGPTGHALSYQWLKNGVPLANGGRISGAQSPQLQILSVTNSDAGQYKAQVTNDCGLSTSLTAVLTVDPQLRIFATGSSTVTVTWLAPGAVLQQAGSATGTWSDVPGAFSPFTTSAGGAVKFFRLRFPP